MKKLNFTLLLSVVMCLSVFAQMPLKQTPNYHFGAEVKPTKSQLKTFAQKRAELLKRSQAKASGSNYPVSFGDALSADPAYAGITEFANTQGNSTLRYLHLWPDSLPVLPTTTAPFKFNWYIHSYADIFSPASKFIANYAKSTLGITDGDLFFTRNNSYSIDSVTIFYGYTQNVPANDSMFIYLINYNSSTFNSVFNFTGDTATKFKVVDYDYVKNAPTGTNITTLKYALTLADTNGIKTIPVNYNLPALINAGRYGHSVGMAISFKPGQSYALGDTLTPNATTAVIHKKLNNFFVLTYEETSGGSMTSQTTEFSYNTGNLVTTDERYNIGGSGKGWNGNYVTTLAYTAPFRYEHAYVIWHLDFEGAAFKYTNNKGVVKFTDVSNNNPSSWDWDMDGDGSTDDVAQNPTYTYTANGNYTVCLIATGAKPYTACRIVKVTGITGIENTDVFSLNSVFPNPVVAGKTLNVYIELKGTSNKANVKLFNTLGQIISENTTEVNDNVTINTAGLKAGMYMFTIEIGGQKTTGKFSVTE